MEAIERDIPPEDVEAYSTPHIRIRNVALVFIEHCPKFFEETVKAEVRRVVKELGDESNLVEHAEEIETDAFFNVPCALCGKLFVEHPHRIGVNVQVLDGITQEEFSMFESEMMPILKRKHQVRGIWIDEDGNGIMLSKGIKTIGNRELFEL